MQYVVKVLLTFCTKLDFLKLTLPLKALKSHIHELFMDARADQIHIDSLKLDYMKDQRLKNSAGRNMDSKDFVHMDYSEVCSDHFVKGRTNNVCAYVAYST